MELSEGDLMSSAYKAFEAKNFSEAAALCTRLIEINGAPMYWALRAVARIRLKEYVDAVFDAEMAIQTDPMHSLGYYRRGEAYFAMGMFEEAKTDFQQAMRLRPGYSDAAKKCLKSSRMVLKEKILGNFCCWIYPGESVKNRIDDFKRQIKSRMESVAEEIMALANNAFKAKEYSWAIDLYTKAIELEENGSAVQDATKAIGIDPKYSKAFVYYRRGVAYIYMKKCEEAYKDFHQVKRLCPNDPDPAKMFEECKKAVMETEFEKAISPLLREVLQHSIKSVFIPCCHCHGLK